MTATTRMEFADRLAELINEYANGKRTLVLAELLGAMEIKKHELLVLALQDEDDEGEEWKTA